MTFCFLIPSLVLGATITRCILPQESDEITVNGGRLFISIGQKQMDCSYWTWSNLLNTKTHYECEEGKDIVRLTIYGGGKKGDVFGKIQGEEFDHGCQSVAEEEKISDPYFAPYIREFVANGKIYRGSHFELGEIPINFVDRITGDVGAVCYNRYKRNSRWIDFIPRFSPKPSSFPPQIIIDREWWNSKTDAIQRTVIISMLLSSCHLNKADNDNYIFNGESKIPSSMTNPEAIVFLRYLKDHGREYYPRLLMAYYEELFTDTDESVRRAFDDYIAFKEFSLVKGDGVLLWP